MTSRRLDTLGIEHTTIDITVSSAALEWAKEHDFTSAPIIVIGDMDSEDFDAWTGFQPDRLNALAARKDAP